MKNLKSNAPRGSIFESVENIKIPQSRHDLSYINHLSCNMGYIYPFYIEETSPSQIMNCRAGLFGRMMPTVSPIMQEINVELRYFYVPYRLLWNNYEDFLTGVGEHIWPCMPISKDDCQVGDLADYLGVDVENITNSTTYTPLIDAMPFRAYVKIWNEYFRDQNLQQEINVCEEYDGQDGFQIDEVGLLNCAWKKDYFTSALPWTQRGAMAQFVGDVFLNKNSANAGIWDYWSNNQWNSAWSLSNLNRAGQSIENVRVLGPLKGDQIGSIGYSAETVLVNGMITDPENEIVSGSSAFSERLTYDPNRTLSVAFDIQQLRMANAVQKFFERSARIGNRYCEYILGMYGVKVGDYRLQRPVYLGGGVMPYQILEVMQNEQAQLDSSGDPYDGSTPQGNLAGIGKINGVFGMNKPFYCPEDGLIMGLMYIRPKANYVTGTRKQMLVGVAVSTEPEYLYVRDRFERIYNPFFEHLGEEAIFSYELLTNSTAVERFGDHMTGRDAQNRAIFGYQSRYAYRKFRGNEVHGDFKTSLLYWHLGRKFSNVPELNTNFIECHPSDRIFAVEDDSNKFLFDIYNKVDAVLPMSAYSIPALI